MRALRFGLLAGAATLLVFIINWPFQAASAAGPYTTSFPLTENPISEGGTWVNGKTAGLDWTDVRTTTGRAFGTQNGGSAARYDDSIAVLTGTFAADQQAQGTVFNTRGSGDWNSEVEILLRFAVASHSARGYEVNFSTRSDSGYATIVRWNGPLGSFTTLASVFPGPVRAGDVVSASIAGNTITAYINGAQVAQATDGTYTSGSPGMGFYVNNRTATGDITQYGFSSYTARDVAPAPTVTPTNTPTITQPTLTPTSTPTPPSTQTPTPSPTATPRPSPTATPTPTCEVHVRVNGVDKWLAKPVAFCR